MKISVVFEFNSTNSSSADTNLDTSRFYQKFYKVARYLASYFGGRCKETEQENIWMAVEKMKKGKRKFERKRKRYKTMQIEDGYYRRA